VAAAAGDDGLAPVSRYNGPASGNDFAHALAVSPAGATVYVTGGSPVSTPSPYQVFATDAYNAATGAQRWVARCDRPAGFGAAGISVAAGPADRVPAWVATDTSAAER